MLSSTDVVHFFVLMIRRPPRATLDRSSAASDVYKRQLFAFWDSGYFLQTNTLENSTIRHERFANGYGLGPVSYTHLRAHETVLDLVCRLLLEKTNPTTT